MRTAERALRALAVFVLTGSPLASEDPVAAETADQGECTTTAASAEPERKKLWSNAVTAGPGKAAHIIEQAHAAVPHGFDAPGTWPQEQRCFDAPASEANGTQYCLPAVLGICCMGAGTSSLSLYLNEHPNLSFGVTKEHRFGSFMRPGNGPSALERPDAIRYAAEWPEPSQSPPSLCFDFSPMYLLRQGQLRARAVRQLLGVHTRFLLLFREPVAAFCKYACRRTRLGHQLMGVKERTQMQARVGTAAMNQAAQRLNEECIFKARTEQEVAVVPESEASATTGQQRCAIMQRDYCVAEMLEPWLEEFPLRQFWLMRTPDIAENTLELLHNVSRFLQVPMYEYPEEVWRSRMHVRGAGKNKPPDEVPREMLNRCEAAQSAPGGYLAACNVKTEQLLHRRWQLPVAALDEAQHAEFMATLVRAGGD